MSARITKEPKTRVVRQNVLEFEHKDGKDKGWWSFCANKDYSPVFEEEYIESQQESYNRCMADTNIVGPFKRVETYKFREDAKAVCECGNEIELFDQYQGACQCEHCGRWHNMFGQTLMDPQYWNSDEYDYGYL